MTIEEVLEEMENLLLDSSRIPFTNKCVILEDDLVRLIEDLREILPKEIDEAKQITSERRRLLEEAQKEAQNILDQAKNYIMKLTDENVITRQAQEQANEIVAQAQKATRDLQKDAVAYADDVFRHLESNLERALQVVREGHQSLLASRQEDVK